MGESAMVGEAEYWISKPPDNIDIGSFRREGHNRGSEGRLAIESGAGEACASQKMSDWFQVVFLTRIKVLVSGVTDNRSSTFTSVEMKFFMDQR
jgi:hypothetical protein